MEKNSKKLTITKIRVTIDSLLTPNKTNSKVQNKSKRSVSIAPIINQHLMKLGFLCEIPYNNALFAVNLQAAITLDPIIIHWSELMTKSN